jgi:hypothetical protein
MCLVRFGKSGAVERIAMCNAKSIEVGGTAVILKSRQDYTEVEFSRTGPVVVAGNSSEVREIRTKTTR